MENVKAEEEVREALAKLNRQRKSIISRSFFRLLIPIGATVVVAWYSSTIIGENRALKAANKVTGKLSEELASLTATSAEQAQTIKQITDNFFKITGKLNEEVSSLRATRDQQAATSAEQAQTIKQITDNFFKVTGKMEEEISLIESLSAKKIAALREENAALKKQLEESRR